MKFSKNDLRQIDAKYVAALTLAQSHKLNLDLLEQVKELMDRVHQNSSNSSRPPSQDPPWAAKENSEIDTELDATDLDAHPNEPDENNSDDNSNQKDAKPQKKPGKQPGAPGHGRTVKLPITDTKDHAPCECIICGAKFDDNSPRTAINGHYVLDVEMLSENLGLSLSHIKHTYYEITCGCGHTTQALPQSADKENGWSVKITEWHLCGPMLVALIVCLSKRYHLSRRKIQEFLEDWLGIHLSKGVINKSIHEAGRAVAPLEETLIDEIENAALLHIDETGWKQFSNKLWLWVFATTTVCLFLVGPRTKAMVKKILDNYTGTVMSDGYNAYRHFKDRLRCWAHLERKLKGLADSTSTTAKTFGEHGLDIFEKLKDAIKSARDGPEIDISKQYSDLLSQFNVVCTEYALCSHSKTSALAKEFLNDWDAIWRILSNIALPMTNNEAERLLRHWVIGRQISFGTRNNEGSRAFALLASVIETCRLREVSPWPYLADVIAARRKNQPVPPLPQPSMK